MSSFVMAAEVDRLKASLPGQRQHILYDEIRKRAYRNTASPGFVQPGDTQAWWHLCWERASDAAFVWHMERDEALGKWLRDITLWLLALPADAWYGPWFRKRGNPPKAALETAHVTLALCEIADLASPLFSEAEMTDIRDTIRIKGMEPCGRYCEQVYAEGRFINNWYCVLLGGYGTAAVLLRDEAAIVRTIQWIPYAANLFNQDSYGESLQYANYAALSLAHLQEVLVRWDAECLPALRLEAYTRLMPWFAASFMHMKPLTPGEPLYPRSVNFSDSAALFRPTGDLLAQIAVRMRKEYPREAALATWLFETAYPDPALGPDELASFGMFNQYGYHAVLMQPDMEPPASPESLGYPTVMGFENGHYVLRDQWAAPRALLAVQAGYESLNVTAHRHQDHGSFQMTVGRERMIVDGGHCCYRLAAWHFSRGSAQHSVFDFVEPGGAAIGQTFASGSFLCREAPLARTARAMQAGDAHILAIDLTDVYAPHVKQARRAFVSVLPGACFVIDAVETARPLVMRDHFALNNRDNQLVTHRATDHKLVFRRHGEAMKLFECAAWRDGNRESSQLRLDWGYVHHYYHPQPNQAGQGKEGSAHIFSWDSAAPGTRHLRVYAMAMDGDPAIKGWHILEPSPGIFTIENPEKKAVLTIHMTPDGQAYLLDGNDRISVL